MRGIDWTSTTGVVWPCGGASEESVCARVVVSKGVWKSFEGCLKSFCFTDFFASHSLKTAC